MACRYTYDGKTYSAAEFMRLLSDMPPATAAQFMPGVQSVPNAPLIADTESWAMLAFRRMVRHAAEHGFDRIAWTTGEQQAARYDLSKQVSSIESFSWGDGTRAVQIVMPPNVGDVVLTVDANGKVIDVNGPAPIAVVGQGLDDVIGKEMAEKVMAVEFRHRFEGNDLRVGGSGMRGFYDDILPKAVNRWAKKLGGRVGETRINAPAVAGSEFDGMQFESEDGTTQLGPIDTGIAQQERAGLRVPSLDLTDAMREVALEGMPLFSRPEAEYVVMSTRGKELGRAGTELEANRMASRLARAGKRVAGVERAQPRPAFSQPDPMTRTNPLAAAGYVQRTDPTVGRTFWELPAMRAAVDAAEASGNARGLLQAVADLPGIRPDLAALAGRLAPLVEQLGVKVEKPDPKVDAGGVYNAKRNGMWIRQAQPTIVVHEALHGVTSAIMDNAAVQKASPVVRGAVREFETMRELLIGRAADTLAGADVNPELRKMLQNKSGPLSNIKELLAYGMTEGDFQQWLAGIPAPPNRQQARNAWDWFKGLVARIVGARGAERSMLDALIESGGDLIDFAEASPGSVQMAQRLQALRLGGLDEAAITMPAAVGRAMEVADRWATKHRNPIPERFDAEQAAAAEKLATFKPGEKLSARATSIKDKAASRLVQKVFDQFRPLKELDPTAFMQAHLSKATDGALEAAFEHGVPVLREGALDVTERTGGFKRVLSGLNGEHDQFLMWVVGNRAEALAQEGREHLFTPQDIAAMKRLNEGAMDDGRNRRQVYGEALRELRRYNGAVLDIAQRAGLIDPEGRKVWESEFYIPFYRVMEDDQTQGPGQIKGLLRQSVIKRLNGGKEPLGDPLENILSNWSHMLTASMRNMAAVRALEAGQKIGIAEGVTSTGRNAEGAKVKGSVWVMQGGVKSHWIVHDPAVLEALESLSFNGYNNAVMRGAGMFKRMLTTTVTISPSFRARNLIRDTLQSIATAEVGFNPVKNIVDGIKIQRDDKLGVTLLAGGGRIRFGAINDGNQARHAKRLIELGIPDQNILDTKEKLGNALRKAYDWWQEFGDKAETLNRAMVYDRAIKAGKSHLEASFEARDVMNFTSMGSASAVRALAQVVPFFNARLQGLDRLARGAKRNPQRFWSTTGVLALASALLYLLNHDDDDYKKLPDWVRDTYWVARLPYTDKFLYIPKPFEVGALATIVERGTELAVSGPDYEAKDFAMNLLGLLSSQLQMNPVPQIARPIMEAAFNYDMFRQAPIDTLGQQRLLPQDRYTARTSAAAVVAGQATGISPQRLEHMVSGYLGWVGTQVLNASDYLIRPAAGLPASPQRDLTRINNVFVLGDFVKDVESVPSKYVTRFYETQRELDAIYASASLARKSGDMERVQALLSDPRMRARPLFQNADKQITRINQQIRAVTANRELGAREKNDRLEALNARRNQIAMQVDLAARELE